MTTISPERIAQIEARRDALQAMMATGDLPSDRFVAVSKEYAELEPVAAAAGAVRRLREEAASLAEMARDGDPELRAMAAEELRENEVALAQADHALALSLLPRDAADERAAMLEIRAGTGGDEAALFAGDLLRMYTRYAEGQGWKVEMISASTSEAGGYKEVVAGIAGKGVFAFRSPKAAAASTPAPRPSRCCPRRKRSMSTSATRICASTSIARPARAGSMSTRPTARSASRTFPPASS
jgi:peptide chain release factor 1